MNKIKIVFHVTILGKSFNEIDFSDTSPEFFNIELRPLDQSNDQYQIFINKNVIHLHESYLDPILDEATLELERFKYTFSYAADVLITDLKCVGYEYEGSLKEFPRKFGCGHGIECKSCVIAGEKNVKVIKEKMLDSLDIDYLRRYYDSVTIKEPIGKFISLYTLLQLHFSDKQSNVDIELLKLDKTISQTKSPIRSGQYETVFTRLRNELSHARENTNILRTHDEVIHHLKRFEYLVKELILKPTTRRRS